MGMMNDVGEVWGPCFFFKKKTHRIFPSIISQGIWCPFSEGVTFFVCENNETRHVCSDSFDDGLMNSDYLLAYHV